MSKTTNLHNGPGNGTGVSVLAEAPGIGVLHAFGATVPTDGTIGYAPGCIFANTGGSTVNTVTYVNIGTKASCNFDPLTG